MSWLWGNTFVKQEQTVTFDEVKKSQLIGLYFSGRWCNVCKYFTPKLVDFYKKVNREKKQFEVIFISSDHGFKNFQGYYSMMPWLAVPYQEQDRIRSITAYYRIRGIPNLIILDKDSNVITYNGVLDVESKGVKAFKFWQKLKSRLTEGAKSFLQNFDDDDDD